MTDPVDPGRVGDERTTLIEFLDYFRAVLLRKAEGLTEEQARVTVAASELHMLGLIRHMVEVEHGWFVCGMGGRERDTIFDYTTDPDDDFHPSADDTLAEALDMYRRKIIEADEVIAASELDQLAVDTSEPTNLRWILVHLIEELARHCGHADLIRESIDGATGD